MNRPFRAVILTTMALFFAIIYSSFGVSAYKGSQAYNQINPFRASVNTATGTFRFSYPLVKAVGIHHPLQVNLTYRFNSSGMFGLPRGWELDVDYIEQNTAVINGQEWLIDSLWHDEHLFSSGLKYFNQHGTWFKDEGEERAIEPGLLYRYKTHHKDGSENYFSQLGLLVLKKDRFGNRIAIEYEEPVHRIDKARLAAITDNYGHRYTFIYEPGSLIVRYPDGNEQHVYMNDKGVSSIVNPMQQRYDFSYYKDRSYPLIKTMHTPLGLVSVLSYGEIPFISQQGEGTLPVVTHFKQYAVETGKTLYEAFYDFGSSGNYTGYPLYNLSKSSDGLVDSNDQNYRYKVTVKQSDGDPDQPVFHHKVYEYNFLHLPMEVRTLKDSNNSHKVEYTYDIEPFRYSRSTNYDKPTSQINSLWSEQASRYIPLARSNDSYDLFGNKTREEHFVYHRGENNWRHLRTLEHKYYTDSYSLLAETIDHDLLSKKATKTHYLLSPSKKTHHTQTTLFKGSVWQPWQQIEYRYDDFGRETFSELKWLARGMPGVQKTHKKTRYHFDKKTGLLTTEHENSLGHVTTRLSDTRNDQLLSQTSALGEKTTYRYNKLNQLIESTEPDGNVYKTEHYTYAQDGLNAMVSISPLGLKQRMQIDPLGRKTTEEYQLNGNYQLLDEKIYNAFGKVALHKNQFGQQTRYQYDGLLRIKEKQDPWLNKITFQYNDEALEQRMFLNNRQYKKIKVTPWLLTTYTTHYPLSDGAVVENKVEKNSFGLVLSEESALRDSDTACRHSVVKNTYEYDPSHNKSLIETTGFDGVSQRKYSKYDLFNNLHTLIKQQNDNGKTYCHRGYQYFYNSDNKLARIVSPEAQLEEQFRYDANGRLIEHKLPDGHRIKKTYNNIGLLSSTAFTRKDKPYKVESHYDADGRLTQLEDSSGQKQSYQYDQRGNLTQLTYPDKRQQKYTYDPVNRITKQENVGNTAITYQYEEHGKLASIHSGPNQVRFNYGKDDNDINGQLLGIERDSLVGNSTERLGYGAFGRVTQTTVHGENGALVLSNKYEFLPRGELVKQTTQTAQSPAQVIGYQYDSLKRLTKESHHPSDTLNSVLYEYDGNNNLVKEQRLAKGGKAETIQRRYNMLDQLVRVERDNDIAALQHNSNGHIVVDHQGRKYQYDDLGLLESVTDAGGKELVSFEYLPDGLLGHLSSARGREYFYYDLNKRTLSVFKNQQHYDFIRHNGKSLMTLTAGKSNGEQLFLTNQSTGARLHVDEKGKASSTVYTYEGYGRPITEAGHSESNFLWNQELRESATGLVYLKNRFYHPELKRFISRDHRKVENRYSYAHANPVTFIDPMGSSTEGFMRVLGGVFMLLIGAVMVGVTIKLISMAIAGPSLLAVVGGIVVGGVAAGIILQGVNYIGTQIAMDYGSSSLSSTLKKYYGNTGLLGYEIDRLRGVSHSVKPPKSSKKSVNEPRVDIPDLLLPTLSTENASAKSGAFETDSVALMSDWQLSERYVKSEGLAHKGGKGGEEHFMSSTDQLAPHNKQPTPFMQGGYGLASPLIGATSRNTALNGSSVLSEMRKSLIHRHHGRLQQIANSSKLGSASLARPWLKHQPD